MEPCGFCNGTGRVNTPGYDREGRAKPVRQIACEYCGGDGVCEGGSSLLGATRQTVPDGHADDLKRAGLPAWA